MASGDVLPIVTRMTVGDVASTEQVTQQQRAGQQLERMPGSESSGIVQRLDELMRECREGHRVTYLDLILVRYGDQQRAPGEVQRHPV